MTITVLDRILMQVLDLQKEVQERVKSPKGYGNSYDNGIDKGWLECLIFMEAKIRNLKNLEKNPSKDVKE